MTNELVGIAILRIIGVDADGLAYFELYKK
jgi:hypothetical protein